MSEQPIDRSRLLLELAQQPRRVLVCGPPGSDRVPAAGDLAAALSAAGRDYPWLDADPAHPLLALPGTVARAHHRDGGWQVEDWEPLCSLDGSRFRLPLLLAVQRLLRGAAGGGLLLYGPGLARGIAGAELLAGLVEAAGIDAVLWLAPVGAAVPGWPAVRDRRLQWWWYAGGAATGAPARRARRDARWRDYLQSPVTLRLPLAALALAGTPPPTAAPSAWCGRQVALFSAGRARCLGVVAALDRGSLSLRLGREPGSVDRLLLRDALAVDGSLRSAPRHDPHPPAQEAPAPVQFLAQATDLTKGPRLGPVPVARIGDLSACLVNGVFGDPLLKVQLLHRGRTLLFDLGDPGRMAARVAHRVTDVFLSHAHADHIGGFLWFLRSRIGPLPACRIHGPPGTARRIAGMVEGILWDRVEDRAPRFEVREWHGDHLRIQPVVAGEPGSGCVSEEPVAAGVVWREPGFLVRSTRLDHGVPVLAYALETSARIRVCRDRLQLRGWSTGPWLQALKQAWLSGETSREIALPDGSRQTAGELAPQVLLVSEGEKLVYATDLADTPANRERLVELASGAHTLFCEAPFAREHAAQASLTGHLTTTACAAIANAAGVGQLLPFHFSKRYISDAAAIYRELQERCDRTVVPPGPE